MEPQALSSVVPNLLLLFVLAAAIHGATAEPRLVMAQILFRHGMRAPDAPYPTDPFQDEALYWPNGWGQLTNFGKEQQYLLGKFLRSRYSSLLTPVYNRSQISIVSTDYERTILSASLTLAGLYPNEEGMENEYSYSTLDWQPIPIHTISDGQNRLMLHHSYTQIPSVCPRLHKFFHEDMMNHPDVVSRMEENADLVALIQERTGFGEMLPWFHLAAGFMMGALYVQKFHNLPIPDWAAEVLDDPKNLEFFGESYSYITLTDETKRLAGGPLLKEWIQNMKSAAAGAGQESPAKNLYVYSAHDLNLATILNTMGLYSPTLTPEMGSTLFIELYHDQDEEVESEGYTIQMHYRDGMTTEIRQLHLPGCATPCTLESFEQILSKFLPGDLDKECQLPEDDDDSLPKEDDESSSSLSTLEIGLIATVCVLGVALLAMTILVYLKMRK